MQTKRALILDNDKHCQKSLETQLKFHGINCFYVDSVSEAIKKIDSEKPNLLFLNPTFCTEFGNTISQKNN